MNVLWGVGAALFGLFFVLRARHLERRNAASSARLFGEDRSARMSTVHTWVFRLGGALFFVVGTLTALGVIEPSGQNEGESRGWELPTPFVVAFMVVWVAVGVFIARKLWIARRNRR
ncbi:hypothetical protein [Streptomyces sp. NPDC060194]|uniref:hypothetical protein n=1 Tax=Streptomyces sp. NPDC060194 TaxID=3347069 RepID=UPI0036497465